MTTKSTSAENVLEELISWLEAQVVRAQGYAPERFAYNVTKDWAKTRLRQLRDGK